MGRDIDVFEPASRKMLDQHPGDERGRMLRASGVKTAGRFYAFVTGDDVAVKLPAARVADLIATGVGRPCEPRQGRPMKQWVLLRPTDEPTCAAYLMEAHDFVASLTNR